MATIVIDARIINSTTGRYVERLLHYLEKLDRTNHYTVLVPTKDLGFYVSKNPNFSLVASDFDHYSFDEQLGFKKQLDELGADLVHFCMPQQPVMYKGQHITTIHDLTLLKSYSSDKNYLVYKAKQLVGRFVFKNVAQSSAAIITPSEFTKHELVQFSHINPEKVIVTYEGADKPPTPSVPYPALQKSEFIMYVGNQNDYKNVRRLIEAHQLLRQKHPSLLLVLVGRLSGRAGTSLRRNQAWSEEQGHQGVVWTDFVPDDQLAWLYEHTQAYVFPSLMEGFGLPGLEAMLYGAPVVSSNATCLPEVYGEAAHYFNPTNLLDMTRAIDDVIGDAKLRDDLIERGYRQAKKYSWKKMAEQTLDLYKHTLGQ